MDAAGAFDAGMTPLDVAPDGSMVLARTDGFGFGKRAELRIYAHDGDKVNPVAAWIPYNHHVLGGALAQTKAHAADGDATRTDRHGSLHPDADVEWAAFVDAKHVLSISRAGELALWEIPKIRPVYVVHGRRSTGAQRWPGIHRGGRLRRRRAFARCFR